jgi:hypothetical protein
MACFILGIVELAVVSAKLLTREVFLGSTDVWGGSLEIC